MRPTHRGAVVSAAALSLLFASALFDDFILEAALSVVLIFLAYDLVWVTVVAWRPDRRYLFVRTKEAALTGRTGTILSPGEESVERVRLVKAGGQVRFKPGLRFLSVEPPSVPRGTRDSQLEFKFKSPYAGRYRVEDVGIEAVGPFGLASSNVSVPFKASFSVYPRVVSVAASSINLFGRWGFGGTAIDYPGIGTEFYEMRGYQRGDDYRGVNWKASARRNELIVNEKMREAGVTYLLVLDAVAPGFFDVDRLASTFLSLANSLAAAGIRFAILVHEGDEVTHVTAVDDPRKSLAVALRVALRFADLGSEELKELAPIPLAAAVTSLLGTADGQSALVEIPRIRAAEIRSEIGRADAWRRVLDFVRDGDAQNIVFVSGLFERVEPLLELTWKARRLRDVDIVVADPCAPWIGAADDATGCAAYETQQKAIRALRASNIQCYGGEPTDVSMRVLSHQG